MKELFDVHCHMVPGVDDGAADLEESLEMLKMQHEDGVRKIIITPHYRRRMFETPAKKVHEQFLKLQEAAKKEYPDMSLYLGCELHSNMDLQDILEKRKYVTMAGSSYVLLEFSEGDSAQHIRERVYNVLSCGYEPIIAHVERYQATVKSVGFSSDLVDMGARLQVNVESILGKYTWGAKRYCRKHMVPGVDDGAADLEESLEMLKMQHEDGVRKIIITPHYRRRMFETPAKKVHEQFLKLQEAAKKEYPDMSLYLGCELHSNMDLQDILEKRKYVTMAGSSYVLLEFSEGDSAQHIRERVYNVLSCGYEPIIAHVERYQATVKSVGFSSDLVDMGARLQVNVESILGKYTWGAKRYCRKLMKEDLLGFVGSDSHNTKTRIPNIGAGAAYVSKKMGEAYAERIFHDNPMEILRDAGEI